MDHAEKPGKFRTAIADIEHEVLGAAEKLEAFERVHLAPGVHKSVGLPATFVNLAQVCLLEVFPVGLSRVLASAADSGYGSEVLWHLIINVQVGEEPLATARDRELRELRYQGLSELLYVARAVALDEANVLAARLDHPDQGVSHAFLIEHVGFLAAVTGGADVRDFSESMLRDRKIRAWMKKVEVRSAPGLPVRRANLSFNVQALGYIC
jgi:hypothetical protein